jgi:uncharacterized protein (DUF1800 family)
MLLRAGCMNELAQLVPGANPVQAASATIAPLISTVTSNFIGRAKSLTEQLALLLCSSEFQRR